MNAQEMTKQQVHKFLDSEHEDIYYLKDRWNDEKDYEDFKDYEQIVKEIFVDHNKEHKTSFTNVRVNKRFTINCETSVALITLKFNADALRIKYRSK